MKTESGATLGSLNGNRVRKPKTMNDHYWCTRLGVDSCVNPNWLIDIVVHDRWDAMIGWIGAIS